MHLDGKDHYLGPFDSDESKARYRELIAAWQNRHAAQGFPEMTVGQLALAYFGHAQTYYVKNGEVTSEVHCIRNAIKPLVRLFDAIQVRDFSPQKLRVVRTALIDGGCARSTINSQIGRLVRMFRWAVGQEFVSPTIVAGLEAMEPLRRGRSGVRETAPVRPVDAAVVAATLPYLPDAPNAAVRMQQATGARPGEILIMRACDLTMAGDVWEYRPNSHKTEHHGRGRVIPIGPKGQAIIRERLTTDLTAFLFSRHPRRRQSTGAYRKAIQRACEEAFGMPKHLRRSKSVEAAAWRAEHVWHPHQIRHSFGTLARKEGGIEIARTVLGHAHTATTEIYAEKDLDAAKALMARIG